MILCIWCGASDRFNDPGWRCLTLLTLGLLLVDCCFVLLFHDVDFGFPKFEIKGRVNEWKESKNRSTKILLNSLDESSCSMQAHRCLQFPYEKWPASDACAWGVEGHSPCFPHEGPQKSMTQGILLTPSLRHLQMLWCVHFSVCRYSILSNMEVWCLWMFVMDFFVF